MDDVKKMFRTLVNGQSTLKQELLKAIRKNADKIDKLDVMIRSVEKNLTKRLDKIGKSVAYLEDDSPTIAEFENLEK